MRTHEHYLRAAIASVLSFLAAGSELLINGRLKASACDEPYNRHKQPSFVRRDILFGKRANMGGQVEGLSDFGRDYLYAKNTQSAACAARIRSTEHHVLTLASLTILEELCRTLVFS